MRRVTPRVWVAVLPGVSLGAVLFAQAALSGQGFGVTQRDGPPPPPNVRRIPIGTRYRSRALSRRLTRGNPSAVRASPWVEPLERPVPVEVRCLPAWSAVCHGGVVRRGGVSVVPGGATLSGRGGVPVAVAAGLSGTGLSRTVLTDASGQFSFERLPAGQFTLNVFQSQFLQTAYGQKRPGGQGTAIRLGDGEQLNLKIQMMRGG